MSASKAEQMLDALKALLETVPDAVVERNSVLPGKVPAGGLIILRDGDPGDPEQARRTIGAGCPAAVMLRVRDSGSKIATIAVIRSPDPARARSSSLSVDRIPAGSVLFCAARAKADLSTTANSAAEGPSPHRLARSRAARPSGMIWTSAKSAPR